MECSLAKPQADQKSSGGSSNNQNKAALLPNHHPPRVGYGGLVGGAYGGLGAGYGAAAYGQVGHNQHNTFLHLIYLFFKKKK